MPTPILKDLTVSFLSSRDYAKLVSKGVRILKETNNNTLEMERRLRIKAFYLIEPQTPDRREHAYDHAMQAAFDAAAQVGVDIE